MKKGSLASASGIVKILVIIGVMFASLIITNILGLVMSVVVFKVGLISILNAVSHTDYANHSNVNILKVLQIIQAIGLFIIPTIVIAYLFGKKGDNYLKTNRRTALITYVLAVIVIISCLTIIDWMEYVNSFLKLPAQLSGVEQWMKDSELKAGLITKAFLNITTFKGLAINILMIAILPAIGEEFLFRGIFLRLFKDWTKNHHVAIILSALLFSAIHMQFYGFVPRMMLGILLGYLFVWTDNIWVPVLAHFTNNATEVIVSFLQTTGYVNYDLHTLFTWDKNYFYLFISVVLTGLFITYFYFKRSIVVSEQS